MSRGPWSAEAKNHWSQKCKSTHCNQKNHNGMPDSAKKSISDAVRLRWSDPKQRQIQSEKMKMVVKTKPNSYFGVNRGRVKCHEYGGEKLDGLWELDFAKWCDSHSIRWVKCKTYFEYEWNGIRKYFPDFYLPDFNTYIEIKGYETDRDRAKWKAMKNQKFIVLKEHEIKQIREGTFQLSL